MKPYAPRKSFFYVEGVEVPRPVFGIDIDGTLGDYHQHFLRFADAWLGRGDGLDPTWWNYDGTVSLAKHMGVSKARYRKIKLAYRQGGIKRSMPVYDGARELTVALRKRGAIVVICTTRPYLHLNTIEPDTMHWLRRNGIQYDHVLFGEHKYRTLRQQYGSRVVAIIDDLPEKIEQAEGCGFFAILKMQRYNQFFHAETCAVRDLEEARIEMLARLSKWEAENR